MRIRRLERFVDLGEFGSNIIFPDSGIVTTLLRYQLASTEGFMGMVR